MNEVEFGVMDAIKGTAFQRGDLVILRTPRGTSEAAVMHMRERLNPIEDATGVRFLLIGADIDVVLADKEEA